MKNVLLQRVAGSMQKLAEKEAEGREREERSGHRNLHFILSLEGANKHVINCRPLDRHPIQPAAAGAGAAAPVNVTRS